MVKLNNSFIIDIFRFIIGLVIIIVCIEQMKNLFFQRKNIKESSLSMYPLINITTAQVKLDNPIRMDKQIIFK